MTTYRIIVTGVENGNPGASRAISVIGNIGITEAEKMIKNVPCHLCTINDLDTVRYITNELKQNGVTVKMQILSDYKEEKNGGETITKSENEIIAKEKPKSVFKRVVDFIEVSVAIIFLCVFLSGKGNLIAMDLMANLNGNDYIDNPYLEMVQNLQPFDDGESYYSAFSRTFDNNEWTYFKDDNGLRIVQVISTYEDILNDKMITQFTISPTDEKGQFLIEPYAMRVSGRNLTDYEMSLVLAGVFKNDVANALGELFFYSSLY